MSAALLSALAAWRASRSAADADRVDEATLAAIVGWRPPGARTALEMQARWLAEVGDVAHRGWAADALLVKLPALDGRGSAPVGSAAEGRGGSIDGRGSPPAGSAAEGRGGGIDVPDPLALGARFAGALAVRLGALAAADPDPRTARAIARVIVRWPQALDHPHARGAVGPAIVPSLDARTVAELAAHLAGAKRRDQRALIEAILAAAPAELLAAASAPAAPAPADDLGALWAEVRARPDDDTPRQVLADELQRRGDPRGELIALQLAGDGRADPARVTALVRAHGHAWLGGLARLATRVQFARGCVARLELAGSAALTDAGWELARDEPALATVEDLLPGDANAAIYARVLTSPRLVAIRRIEVFDRATFAALATLPPQLAHVVFRPMRGGPAKALRAHLPALARHPLTALTLPLDAFAVLAQSELFGRLRAITVTGAPNDVLRVWPNMPPGATLVCQHVAALDACASAVHPYFARVELRRDGDRVVARATRFGARWAVLPPDVDRFEILGGEPAEVLAIRAEAAGRRLEVVGVPLPRALGALAVR